MYGNVFEKNREESAMQINEKRSKCVLFMIMALVFFASFLCSEKNETYFINKYNFIDVFYKLLYHTISVVSICILALSFLLFIHFLENLHALCQFVELLLLDATTKHIQCYLVKFCY